MEKGIPNSIISELDFSSLMKPGTNVMSWCLCIICTSPSSHSVLFEMIVYQVARSNYSL